MKMLWNILAVMLLINALAMIMFGGWLFTSGRLNQDRVQQIREMLSMTVEQEKQLDEEAQAVEEQAREKALEIARLESVSDGPISLSDRLDAERSSDEIAILRIERLREDILSLQRQLDLAKRQVAEQQADAATQSEAFEQAVQQFRQAQQQENFKQAVSMYEKLKPKQAKQMFQGLLNQGQEDQVVDYLAAMQLRKASAVLREFKSPEEIIQATDLLQRLRKRGVNLDTAAGQQGQAPPAETADASRSP